MSVRRKKIYLTARKYFEAGKPIPRNLYYDAKEMERFKRVARALTELRKLKTEVIKDKVLSPEEKKARIEWIDMEMINRARWALGDDLVAR